MVLRDFEQKLINVIAESNLPIDCVYFVLKSVMEDVYNQYGAYVNSQMMQRMAEEDAEAAAKENLEAKSNQEEVTPAADNNNDKEN